MEKNDDALRTLFSGLLAAGLATGEKADIMARVRERAARRETHFEWLMGGAAAALLAAIVAAVWIFAPECVTEVFSKINILDIFSDIKLPETDMSDISFLRSPMLILVAICGLVLLLFDRMIRNRYNKKHLTDL